MRIGIQVPEDETVARNVIAASVQAKRLLSSDTTLVLIGDPSKVKHLLTCEGAIASSFDCIPVGKADCGNSITENKLEFLDKYQIDTLLTVTDTPPRTVDFNGFMREGIDKPALASLLPQLSGGKSLILDVGLNPDCTAEQLLQFAQLGHEFSQAFLGIDSPRIALMNIGEEEEKGNLLSQKTHCLLKESGLDFIGNVEGRDAFTNKADVIICEGFTGNIILKLAESFYNLTKVKKYYDSFFQKLNFSEEGIMVVLGIRKGIFICRKNASVEAIKSTIGDAKKLADSQTLADLL